MRTIARVRFRVALRPFAFWRHRTWYHAADVSRGRRREEIGRALDAAIVEHVRDAGAAEALHAQCILTHCLVSAAAEPYGFVWDLHDKQQPALLSLLYALGIGVLKASLSQTPERSV